MKFIESYSLTYPESTLSSVTSIQGGENIPSGVFDNGLLIVCDIENKINFSPEHWNQLIAIDDILLCYTGFGDFFFWSVVDKAVYFVEVQRGTKEFIDDDIGWFLNDFLTNTDIKNDVLKEDKFMEIVKRNSPLNYGECFVLEPWEMLGGKNLVENFKKANFSVYIDLVGQAHNT